MIFFTGDTHFQHANIIKYSKRPYDSIEAMDEALVLAWQATVSADDTTYHLGDFSLRWNAATREILSRLPGRKHLILGNHDPDEIRRASAWTSVGDYLELTLDRPSGGGPLPVVLSHYPFAVWNRSHQGAINLHGHCHGTYPGSRQQMDVGVDCTDYKPLPWPEVLARLAKMPPHVPRDRHGAKAT